MNGKVKNWSLSLSLQLLYWIELNINIIILNFNQFLCLCKRIVVQKLTFNCFMWSWMEVSLAGAPIATQMHHPKRCFDIPGLSSGFVRTSHVEPTSWRTERLPKRLSHVSYITFPFVELWQLNLLTCPYKIDSWKSSHQVPHVKIARFYFKLYAVGVYYVYIYI